MGRPLVNWLQLLVEPNRVLAIRGLFRYLLDWRAYQDLAGGAALRWRDSFPQLADWSAHTPFDAHYFFQAGWAARRLSASPPSCHVDVGSSVTMLAVLSGFVPTVFVDVRPLQAYFSGLMRVAGNIQNLPFSDGCLQSVSSLHVIEHVGLGRYGDRLDPNGSSRAAAELVRVLAPGGRLLVSIPVGRERVEFNAHRVFAPETVLVMFEGLTLAAFSMVDDGGAYHANVSPAYGRNAEYACGMFEFWREK